MAIDILRSRELILQFIAAVSAAQIEAPACRNPHHTNERSRTASAIAATIHCLFHLLRIYMTFYSINIRLPCIFTSKTYTIPQSPANARRPLSQKQPYQGYSPALTRPSRRYRAPSSLPTGHLSIQSRSVSYSPRLTGNPPISGAAATITTKRANTPASFRRSAQQTMSHSNSSSSSSR